jgi:hypothetical protein
VGIKEEVARQSGAFKTFTGRIGEEFGAYDSPENGEKIVRRVFETWGREAAYSPDSYEVSFRQLLAENALTRDEHYVPPSVLTEIELMPAGELARRYRMNPEFRKQVDDAARAGRKFQ